MTNPERPSAARPREQRGRPHPAGTDAVLVFAAGFALCRDGRGALGAVEGLAAGE